MCHHCVNRREFLQTSLAVSAGAATAPLISTAAGAATSSTTPLRKYTDIRTAFLFAHDARWPEPNMDPKPEVDPINYQLDRLEKMWKTGASSWDCDIRFTGRELLTNPEEAQRFVRSLNDADGMVVFGISSRITAILKPILDTDYPTVYFSPPPSGHNWQNAVDAIRDGKRF